MKQTRRQFMMKSAIFGAGALSGVPATGKANGMPLPDYCDGGVVPGVEDWLAAVKALDDAMVQMLTGETWPDVSKLLADDCVKAIVSEMQAELQRRTA